MNDLTVANVGEFGLIDRLQKIIGQTVHPDLVLGIGDDTAAIRLNDEKVLLATCDIQIQNQHFRLENITPYQLGRRAMAVNLSDIAAMGGTPTFALVSLAFPKSFPVSHFDDLFQGMRDQLTEFSAFIIGGNLSRSSAELIIDITLLGETKIFNLLTRSKAQPGDHIWVTGTPGLSAAGFHLLEKFGHNYPAQYSNLVQKHLQPVPRIQFAQKLAETGLATAMIDISDGLFSDLGHICDMSQVSAQLNTGYFPSPALETEIEQILQQKWSDLALYGGEDYELLFTCKKATPFEKIQAISRDLNIQITEIGEIMPPDNKFSIIINDHKIDFTQKKGWDHFH
ncbi:thiamine-phosphate kinase [candidate division KSB1 bacterium]|nr:thiamine-phosphate kinase [candidate division KSB1 bacterium]